MGLGTLGRGEADVRFLAEHGAIVTVTDIRDATHFTHVQSRLAEYPIRYVFGVHNPEDFDTADMILRNAGVRHDHPLLIRARSRGIPVRMDEGLFVTYAPRAKIIGITGTRGKTTTTHLIAHALQRAGRAVAIGGNVAQGATLPLLRVYDQDPNTVLVLEMSSWQLQDWDTLQYSPPVAVFTSFYRDHMDYYRGQVDDYLRDKTAIFRHQGPQDTCIAVVTDPLQESALREAPGSTITIRPPVRRREIWAPGEDNQCHAACAALVLQKEGLEETDINAALENFPGVKGRREVLGSRDGHLVVNDSASTTPDATEAALRAYAPSPVCLIMGGRSKTLSIKSLMSAIQELAPVIVLLSAHTEGTDSGTDEMAQSLQKRSYPYHGPYHSVPECFHAAIRVAQPGSSIIFSPGMASFGAFAHAYERDEIFRHVFQAS